LPLIKIVWVVAKKIVGEENRISRIVEYFYPIHIIPCFIGKTALTVEFIYRKLPMGSGGIENEPEDQDLFY
jgi:hypothetical protein